MANTIYEGVTSESVTREQIIALRREAKAAGDDGMADTCGLALAGDEDAVRACERSIGSSTIEVAANPDLDDCLEGAAAELEEHPELEGWDLRPRWKDDDRERVVLTIPGWFAEELAES